MGLVLPEDSPLVWEVGNCSWQFMLKYFRFQRPVKDVPVYEAWDVNTCNRRDTNYELSDVIGLFDCRKRRCLMMVLVCRFLVRFDTAHGHGTGVWYVRDVRWIGCEGVAPINRKISKSAQENHRLSNEAKRSQTNPKVPRREYDILLLWTQENPKELLFYLWFLLYLLSAGIDLIVDHLLRS